MGEEKAKKTWTTTLIPIDINNYTEIREVNLSAFVYRLFHEGLSIEEKSSWNSLQTDADKLTSAISVHKVAIEHSTTCDSRTNLNYIIPTYIDDYV